MTQSILPTPTPEPGGVLAVGTLACSFGAGIPYNANAS
jgi:hypothetical protein